MGRAQIISYTKEHFRRFVTQKKCGMAGLGAKTFVQNFSVGYFGRSSIIAAATASAIARVLSSEV